MKPTREQLKNIGRAIVAQCHRCEPGYLCGHDDGGIEDAGLAWDVIAPIVRAQALEEAIKLCEGERVKAAAANARKMADAIEHCGNLIRVLKDKR